MAYTFRGRTLETVGVVGSGQIGPDIALFFARVLAPHGVSVVVLDVSEDALAAGRARIEKKIAKSLEKGKVKPKVAAAMTEAFTYTTDYAALAGAGFVIEAATEDLAIKHQIFAALEEACPDDAILASNSSHMEPEIVFENAARPERTVEIHYFFPAERNVVVEVVPGEKTDPAVADWLMAFYEAVGKVPIRVGSRYAYAVDPIFEGIFQAAALGVEAGWGSVSQVDAMVKKALHMGVGPFTAMNLTGGNPITAHGLDGCHEKHHAWFGAPQILKDQVESGEPWEVAGRGEEVEYTEEQYETTSRAMMGAYFGLVGQVLDAGITNVGDLDLAVGLALVIRPPFTWMNALGTREALKLVKAYAADHPDFPVPDQMHRQVEVGAPWDIPLVIRHDEDGIMILTIRRPRVLNALDAQVLRQLLARCRDAENDPSIEGVVLTGFGPKAFVSGADIIELSKMKTADDGETVSARFHKTMDFIEGLQKPVVCAMNGMTLGAGNELAMACHARVTSKGLRLLAGQPEVNLGLVPGAGGTQRLTRIIGLEPAAAMMRTAVPIGSDRGLELGLVEEVVDGDLVTRAAALAREYARGEKPLRRIATDPMADVPDTLPEVDIGHRSTVIDAILTKTILEGARGTLQEGLALEIEAFGACVETKDMHIGLTNFLENGPRQPAEFVNA